MQKRGVDQCRYAADLLFRNAAHLERATDFLQARRAGLSERLVNAGMADCGGLAAFRGAVRLTWAGAGPVFLDV
jgi:hypothetical protein